MSQHDYNITNAGGAAVRGDINGALLAILSQNSGPTAPSVTAPGMPWFDTSTNTLKIRNAADTGWDLAVTIGGDNTFTGANLFPTQAVGDNSQKAATTAFVRSEFAASLSSAGWQKLTSGLIIQWGSMTTTTNPTSTTFPISFPTACVNVNISGAVQAAANYQENTISNVTKSGFNSYHDTSGLNKYWFAIGY